jgi:hypothetical protein
MRVNDSKKGKCPQKKAQDNRHSFLLGSILRSILDTAVDYDALSCLNILNVCS